MTNRRSVLRFAAVAGSSLAAGCQALGRFRDGSSELARHTVNSEADGGGTFPMYQRDAGHTGYVDGTATDESGADRWISTVEPPESSSVLVLSPDSAFVVGAGAVYALDRADGSYQWDRRPDATFPTAPVVSDGVLVVGKSFEENTVDKVGVVAYDATDGTEQWETTAAPGAWVQPTVQNGTVYVSGGPVDPGVGAVDLASGAVDWQHRFETETGHLAADDSGVYVVHASGVRKLALDTGSALWNRSTSEAPRGHPTVADGTVYVQTAPTTFAALDAATGERRWEVDAAGETEFSAAVADGTVYLSGIDLIARRADDGTEQWRRSTAAVASRVMTDTPHYGDRAFGELAVTDDSVYVGHGEGLLAVDRTDGTPRWRRPFRNRVVGGDMVVGGHPGAPAVAGDTVFTYTSGGDLYTIAR